MLSNSSLPLSVILLKRNVLTKINSLDYHFIDNNSQKTIVIIPDVYYHHSFYLHLSESVGSAYNYLYIDLPGFGSTVLDKSFGLNDTAEEVDSLLLKLELNQVIIFGHGYGVTVSLLLNSTSTGNIVGLILCSGFHTPVHEAFKEAILRRMNHYLDGDISFDEYAELLRQNHFEYPNSSIAKKWTEHLMSLDRSALYAHTHAFLSSTALIQELDINRSNTSLIIHGEADRVHSPECSEKLSVEVESCTLHILKGKSHALFENNQIAANYINPFLSKI